MSAKYYQGLLKQQNIKLDPAQAQVLTFFAKLNQQLEQSQSFFSKLTKTVRLSKKPIQGLYLWGGVGRGKTLLMDIFYENLKVPLKERFHFHRFMVQVHKSLKHHQGKKDPLKWVAKDFSSKFTVLCFDEFFVSDIADAMLLGELLKYLFEQGVTLIATSNVEPSQLYRNGLQREKFLPAIELLEKHTQVVHMHDGEDYRYRALASAEIYHYPLDDKANENLKRYFKALAPDATTQLQSIVIDDRPIQAVQLAESVAWFSFESLCMTPRSSIDYIELAKMYHTILLSGVIKMTTAHEDAARRFITMVDEFYERNVNLIISAQVKLTKLYHGKHLKFEFERTISRLQEMQSEEYLQRPHLA